jgi:hypothetical protein
VKPKRERLNLTIDKKERGKSLLLSVVIHVVVIFALAAITFRYPLGQLIRLPKDGAQTRERLQYMVLPRGQVGNGSASTSAQPAKGRPAPLQAPAAIPATLPPAPAKDSTSGSVSGKAGGNGGAPAGIATGVEPIAPDPRIQLNPAPYEPTPRTAAERVDSAVMAAFGVYID